MSETTYYLEYRLSDGYVVAIHTTNPVSIDIGYGIAMSETYVPGDEWENKIIIYTDKIVDGWVTESAAVKQAPPAVELLTKLADLSAYKTDAVSKQAFLAARDAVIAARAEYIAVGTTALKLAALLKVITAMQDEIWVMAQLFKLHVS